MSYTIDIAQVSATSTTPSSDDFRALIPVIQADGYVLYKQNRAFRAQVFPLNIEQHMLKMDPDNGWRYFDFNPSSKIGKMLITKYTNVDDDGARYTISHEGQKVYGENAIATAVLNRLHIDYMNKNWVRIWR